MTSETLPRRQRPVRNSSTTLEENSSTEVREKRLRTTFSESSGQRRRYYRDAYPEQGRDGEISDRSTAVSSDEGTDHDLAAEIPLYAPSIPPSIVESGNDSGDENNEINGSRSSSLKPSAGFEVYNIQVSRYLEDEYGTDEVHLEMEHEPISTNASGRVAALFRWIHVKQEPMDFDAFLNAVQSLPDLTNEERENAVRLLRGSQKQAQKPFRTKDGIRGRIFDSHFLSKQMPREMPDIEDRCFFYSLPYFWLRKHADLSIPSHSSLQPTRTLLQTRDPSTPKGRDLAQIVCHLSETPKDYCFHLSTFWCLVIKDKYLVTCSVHSGPELSGELLNIISRPPSQASATELERTVLLQVSFEDALYMIPLNECDSWFKFTQRFSVFGNDFDDVYDVQLGRRRIESGQWHTVIRRARARPMRTRIIVSHKYVCGLLFRLSAYKNRKYGSSRPLNQPLLGGDDLSDIDISQPSTPSRTAPSNTSFARLEDHASTVEEGGQENSARKRPGRSDARLQARLSPDLSTPDPLTRLPSASPMSFECYLQDFHALRWISLQFTDLRKTDDSVNTTGKIPRITRPDAMQPRRSYDEKVETYLEKLHEYMQFNVGIESRVRYRNCSEKTLKQVEKELRGISREGLDHSEAVQLKKDIVTAAKSIFVIFLPLDQKGTIVSRYWGAVHDSIISKMSRNIPKIRETVQVLMRIARLCIDKQAQLSKGKGPNPAETKLPAVEFVNAWLFLLICLLHLTDKMAAAARRKASSCEKYLQIAIETVMTKFEGKALPQLRAPVPSELSVLFAYRVLQDMTADLPNVSDTYWNYFTQLTSTIRKDPLNKGHRAEFAAFFEELDIVQNRLKEQQGIITRLQDGPLAQRNHERHTAFSGRYHLRLLKKCNDHLSGTKESLSELQRQARSLEISTMEYMQSNKERQERAIYIFTIVTIVFLPISTVSSIFGMNSRDIRDMNHGQWLFWAVAIPVTSVIVVGSLFGAGVISYRR